MARKKSQTQTAEVVHVSPNADLVTELEVERSSITEAMKELSDFSIETASDLQTAAELLNDVVGRKTRINERLAEITKPMRQAEKSVRDLFRPVQDAMEEAETWLKGRIDSARKAIEARNRDLLEQSRAAVANGDLPLVAALTSELQPPSTPDGVQFRSRWTFEIVDESQVPREFLRVDEKAIRAAVKASKGKIEIPGVRVYEDTTVAAVG